MSERVIRSRPVSRGRARRTGIGAAGVAIVAATSALAGPASAHVKPDPSSYATQGGSGVVKLLVPDESDTASTIGLTVTFPDTVDLTSARTVPIPGWTARVQTVSAGPSDRVSKIVWTADSPKDGLTPTEFGIFTFSGSGWPTGATSVTLPSDQLYSDGSVVSWSEVAVDGTSAPEHPAPVLALTPPSAAAAAGSDGAAAASPEGSGQNGSSATVVAAGDALSSTLIWAATSVAGLVVGGAVTGLVLSVRRGRRPTVA